MKKSLTRKVIFLSVCFCIVSLVMGILLTKTVKADPVVYYFNNAVNHNPETLGNYWLDAELTIPATSLPNLEVDEVNIISEAEYDGNIIFNGTAVNEGRVMGDAIFYEDSTENLGTVSGVKTRYYTITSQPSRNFMDDGPWIVVADGVEVDLDLNGSIYDLGTTFSAINGGYFLSSSLELTNQNIIKNSITLTYNTDLNQDSIPLAEDFQVLFDATPVGIIDVNVTGNQVVILLDQDPQEGRDAEEVFLSYDFGQYLITDERGLNAHNFSNISIVFGAGPSSLTVGTEPVYGTLVGTKLYVSNKMSDSVSVINTETEEIITTISVGDGPEMSVLVGNKLFVNNIFSANVSVINTLTNSVSATIAVGSGPYFSTVVGTKVYVSNTDTNTVSVINTNTNTVTATITVGSAPWNLGSVGTKVYVPNRLSGTVSVIDTVTDTVLSTISITSGGAGSNAIPVGTTMYVGGSNAIYAINTVTDTITATISLGSNPYFSCRLGTKIYTSNRNGSSVSVIDSQTNTVSSTIPVSIEPTTCVVLGSKIFVTHGSNENGVIEVINTSTDTVSDRIAVGLKPFYATPAGSKLFVSNNASSSISVINTNSIYSERPDLISFTSTTDNGTYTSGQNINITANFGRLLEAGSSMTVELNSGAEVVLNTVSGKTLTGIYTIVSGETTPDLAVDSVVDASVTDLFGNTQTEYEIPSSQGNLVAENSFIKRNIGDSKNIVIGSFYNVTVGSNPYQVSAPITVNSIPYVYVANQGSNNVSVVRTTDNTVVSTINAGTEPYGVATVTLSGTTYLYVANTGSDNVTVINTSTNTVVATVLVGVKPYYVAVFGTDVYVSNSQSNTVSVINANTNTVSATIPVGSYPRGIKAVAGKVYVANYGDPNYTGGNSVSVINPATNTVSTVILMPSSVDGPRGLHGSGTSVYVANFRSNNVSIINTNTNTVSATIAVGLGPRGITPLGTNVYVENFDDGTISVIDTNTNTVSATIKGGHSLTGMGISETDIYYSRFQDDALSKLNTLTNTLYSAPDITAPVISAFSVPSSSSSSSVTVLSFSGTDNIGVTGYLIKESASTPSSDDGAWSETAPGSYVVSSGNGEKILYAWLKDAAGNISSSSSASVTIFSGGGNGIIPPSIVGVDAAIVPDNNDFPNLPTDSLSPLDSESLETSLLDPGLVSDSDRLKSNLFLAVQDKGTLWYVDPATKLRYPIQQASILNLLKISTLGITNVDLKKIPIYQPNAQSVVLPSFLQGRFLLQVQDKGKTWYTQPSGFLHRITVHNIINVTKNFARGILDKDLKLIKIGSFR